MVISSKGRYALRVMVYLAVNHDGSFIPLKEISQHEELSQKYLESIATVLSKGHLIEAASGHKGGYHLSRKPEEYSIGEVLRMTEGSLAPVACLKEDAGHCDQADLCYTLPIWQGLADLINNYFDNMTLADVAGKAEKTVKE